MSWARARSSSVPLLLQFARHGQGLLDVAFLRRLVAAEEQEVDGRSFADEIDPVSRTDVDPHFADAFADRLRVAEIALFGADQPRGYARLRFLIGEAAEPSVEPRCSSKSKHEGLYPFGYRWSSQGVRGYRERLAAQALTPPLPPRALRRAEALRPANEVRFEARWKLGLLLAKMERSKGRSWMSRAGHPNR